MLLLRTAVTRPCTAVTAATRPTATTTAVTRFSIAGATTIAATTGPYIAATTACGFVGHHDYIKMDQFSVQLEMPLLDI